MLGDVPGSCPSCNVSNTLSNTKLLERGCWVVMILEFSGTLCQLFLVAFMIIRQRHKSHDFAFLSDSLGGLVWFTRRGYRSEL